MRLTVLGSRSKMPYLERFGAELNSQGIMTTVVEALKPTYLSSRVPPLGLMDLSKHTSLLRRTDAVFVDDPLYGAALAHLHRKKLFVHLRGHVWSEGYWRRELSNSLRGKISQNLKYLVRMKCLQFADVLLPTCNWLTNETTIRLPEKPAYTLYQGIDVETWAEDSGDRMQLKHPALLTVFNFDVYPKTKGLLKFIDMIKNQDSMNLYIAGDGPYRPRNIEAGNVHFVGKLAYPHEVKRFYYSGDLYVHPSGQDCCPIVLLEAPLCGLPIIASGVGGIPEIVKDGKTGCIVNNPVEWKEKILYYLKNTSEAKRLAENARKFVTGNFSWKTVVRHFIPILEST